MHVALLMWTSDLTDPHCTPRCIGSIVFVHGSEDWEVLVCADLPQNQPALVQSIIDQYPELLTVQAERIALDREQDNPPELLGQVVLSEMANNHRFSNLTLRFPDPMRTVA